jgi:hypothetical protein
LLFKIGLSCASLSALVLGIFGIHAAVLYSTKTPYDLDRAYPVLSMMFLAFLGAGLGFSGRGLSRFLLLGTGLATLVAWYLAALGASP